MKRKIVPPVEAYTIVDCCECVHACDSDEGMWCSVTNMIIPDQTHFPDWCPLEDAKEDEDEQTNDDGETPNDLSD